MSAVINGDSFNGSISVESRARTSFVLEREREREREYPHTVMDRSGHRREICVGSNEFSNGSSWFARVVCILLQARRRGENFLKIRWRRVV